MESLIFLQTKESQCRKRFSCCTVGRSMAVWSLHSRRSAQTLCWVIHEFL